MRCVIKVLLLAGMLLVGDEGLRAQEAADRSGPVTFVPPFEPLSALRSQSQLVLMLVSDQPAVLDVAGEDGSGEEGEKAERPVDGSGRSDNAVWFLREFQLAMSGVLRQRPDLKERVIGQQFRAGVPPNLSAPAGRSLPPKAFVLICDGNYRLLSLSVGVPEVGDLLRLIEDAEETQTLLTLHADEPQALQKALLERTRQRARRDYVRVLDNTLPDGTHLPVITETGPAWETLFRTFAVDVRAVYLFDCKLRFGLTDATDLVRLMVLEQHCETRRDWCDSVSPFVAGRPLGELLRRLLESVWEAPAVVPNVERESEEILEWVRSRRESSTVTLAIAPDFMTAQFPWPPLDVGPKKFANRGWDALEKAMSGMPFRTITVEDLSRVLSDLGAREIALHQPSRCRYVVFSPRKKQPIVIRESDLPGNFFRYFEER